MPLDVIQGESKNRAVATALADQLRMVVDEGTVYLGYPMLATADQTVEVDALLVSQAHGLVAFLISDSPANHDWVETQAAQDRLYAVLEAHLARHTGLRAGRQLALTPNTGTIFAAPVPDELIDPGVEGFYGTLEEVAAWVSTLSAITPEVEHNLHAALQRVTTIKPAKKRASVAKESSRGAILKEIEKGIANLDRWQKAAAIESPEGPQRIRGLAGSGKTVVLALKAAYWHTTHPEWRIVMTFHSRALYQQINDLVTRFTFEHSNDAPDRDRLRILHSWGSRSSMGVYSMMAVALGETPRDWAYAQGKFGYDNAFQGVCQELLAVAQSRSQFEPLFDAVLIDEAQDLPPEFFQLVYLFTKPPKRVVWGFDELQRLSEAAMPTTEELFGRDRNGASLVSLETAVNAPRRDIVLPVCYRNTPWALATAHALGIGVYRKEGLVQHPDQPALWQDIGYNVVHGRLELGHNVTLQRSAESYPTYFPTLLNAHDAVVVQRFDSEGAQDAWVAEQVLANLVDDELEHDDILIVLPDTYRAKSRAPRLMSHLGRLGIPAHLVGVNTSADEIFQSGSVALAHIYRAKGNEAPMVYAVDSQHASGDFNQITKRNTIFTAITRSRAWVRVTGWGDRMQSIADEVGAVADEQFQLQFTIPTQHRLERLRHIHRDRPAEDLQAVQKATEGVASFLELIDRGEMDWQDLPPALRTRLAKLRAETNDDVDF